MKKMSKILPYFIFLFLLSTNKLQAQCTSTSQHATGTAPVQGISIKASSCMFAGEYFTLYSTVSGNTYSVTSSVLTDYITIRIGAANGGTVLATGSSPLVFTPTVSGTFYIICSTSSSCGTESVERDVYLGCLGPECTNSISSATNSAPSPSNTTLLVACQNAGEYTTLTNVVAGNLYVSNSSIVGDYFTIRSGTYNGPVVATGPSPLTWTAQIAGTHFIHVNTNSICATQSSCRANSITCIGPLAPPINDLCTNATTLSVPSTTAGTTMYASIENPSPGTCGTTLTSPGVWYRVSGNGNQFGASLCASSNNSKLFVYTGSCGAWTCVTGNDNNGPLCTGSAASATWCTLPSVDYFILVTSACGSDAFTIAITQTINPSTPTVAVSAANPSVCLTLSTALTATGASSYLWNTGATSASISVTPTSTTIYTVLGRASLGCGYDIKTVTVTSLPNPTISLSPSSASICPANSVIISAGGANSYTYNSVSSGSFVTSTGIGTLSPTTSTTYSVSGIASNGCISTSTIPVSVNPLPPLMLATTNTFLCLGGSATLTASGANNYTWTSGSNASLQVVSPIANTVYAVSGDNSYGCIKTLSLAISVNTIVMTVSPNTVICSGNSTDLSASGATTYVWAPIPFPFGNVTVSPSVTTNYTVMGTDSKSCVHTSVITVSVNPNPVVSAFSSPFLICLGESSTLTATGASSYLWSINSATFNTGSQITVLPLQPSTLTYTVSGTDVNACKGMNTVVVEVEKCTDITALSKEINGINVYPNPTNGSFKVELINGLKKSISVSDVSGRLVLSIESTEDVIDINLSSFSNGIYYLKVQSESSTEVIHVIKH